MMSKKIYAAQSDPAESTYLYDYFSEDDRVVVAGNKDYAGIKADLIKDTEKLCDDMYYDDEYDACSYDKADGSQFTDGEFKELKAIVKKPFTWREAHEEFTLAYLSMYFGEPYSKHVIRGCCQGEWQDLYCPTSYSKESIDYVEAVYFNTGTRIVIHDEDYDVDDPNEIRGYAIYLNEYDEGRIKKAIANEVGGNPEDVVLWMFDGYTQVAKYKRV